MKCDKDLCMCDVNLDDNGYEYILSELKDTRRRLDRIISLIESRQKKDNIIDDVLKSNYDDEECDCKEEKTLNDIIKLMAIQNILTPNNTYPDWRVWHSFDKM